MRMAVLFGLKVLEESVAMMGQQSIAVDTIGRCLYTCGSFENTADFDPGPGVFNMISQNYEVYAFISKLGLQW
jgi:hypothetical protein